MRKKGTAKRRVKVIRQNLSPNLSSRLDKLETDVSRLRDAFYQQGVALEDLSTLIRTRLDRMETRYVIDRLKSSSGLGERL